MLEETVGIFIQREKEERRGKGGGKEERWRLSHPV